MNDIESHIQASYRRLRENAPVYLLRSQFEPYDELPSPDAVRTIYKATVADTDTATFTHGAAIVDWVNLDVPPVNLGEGRRYSVSPREVFLRAEMLDIIRTRTGLFVPKPKKLNRFLASESGKFPRTLAAEMARVVLERFADDPRSDDGRLIQKR